MCGVLLGTAQEAFRRSRSLRDLTDYPEGLPPAGGPDQGFCRACDAVLALCGPGGKAGLLVHTSRSSCSTPDPCALQLSSPSNHLATLLLL